MVESRRLAFSEVAGLPRGGIAAEFPAAAPSPGGDLVAENGPPEIHVGHHACHGCSHRNHVAILPA